MATAKQAELLHAKAKAFFAKRNAKDLEACRMLYEVKAVHKASFGYGYWAAYMEGELGLNKREGERMIRVWEHFGVKLAGRWEWSELAALGMSKLRMLVRLTDAKNIRDWIKRAASMPYCALERAAIEREYQARTDEDKPIPATYVEHFGLTKAEIDVLNKALSIVRGESRDRRKGALLSVVVSEWLEGYEASVVAVAA